MHDYQRPPTLHRYGVREDLQLSLTEGQFILRPASNCLTLSLSQAWDRKLFELFTADEADEREWQFAWRAMQSKLSLNPVLIKIGSLENFAELRDRDTYLA